MTIITEKIKCPNCNHGIVLPWLPDIHGRKLQDDYDMCERDAQEILNDLWNWLFNVSLWGLLKFWWENKRNPRGKG